MGEMHVTARPSDLVLHQFRASHFNDKARWALAHKGLPHRRISYLPGPHQVPIRKLSGQTSTPVLVMAGNVFAGSAQIIDALEGAFPDNPLYPADARLRAEALAIQSRFDAQVGPATRTAAFTVFVRELSYVSRLFAHGEPALKQNLYRAALPLVRPLMAKANGVADANNVREAFDTVAATLDWIATSVRDRSVLVGESFSVADLTVAALMSPLVALDHPDMAPPPPLPPRLEQFYARWRDHPGLEWVRTQYRLHRPPDAAVVQ